MSETIDTWPPAYTLTPHARARHVRLKASVKHGLQLVVPKRFNARDIPNILEQNRTWIEKQLTKIHEQRKKLVTTELPSHIHLHAIQQDWIIHYINSTSKLQLLVRPHLNELVLLGQTENHQACAKLLSKWVKSHAQAHLTNHLNAVSTELELPFAHVSIRGQTSRWGSCTSAKAINLNYKLLFLPAHLMRHILIHELCHTVHMNHSSRFWKCVAKYDPNWKDNNREIRKADSLVPWWAL